MPTDPTPPGPSPARPGGERDTPEPAVVGTLRHIRRVSDLLGTVAAEFIRRAQVHDASKLEEPEASAFEEYTGKLRGCTYLSEEYKDYLRGMKPALDHHYRHNSHHPEHYPNGIYGMTLFDLLEMLVDWKAATERHADGSLAGSINLNQLRFLYDDGLKGILWNTAAAMGLLEPEAVHAES